MARLLQGGPKDVSCPLPWSLKTLPSFQKWGRDLYQGTRVGLGEYNSRRLVLRDILGGGSPKGVEEDASPYAVLWLVVVVAVMWGGLEGLGEDISLLSHPRGSLCFPRPLSQRPMVVSKQSWLWHVVLANMRNSLQLTPLISSLIFSLTYFFDYFLFYVATDHDYFMIYLEAYLMDDLWFSFI